MFTDRSSGCEQSNGFHAHSASGSGVQSFRLGASPLLGGSWCIPGISAGVPSVLKIGETLAPQHMAAFALKADAMGVPLPKGKFASPKHSIEKQWRNFIAATCGSSDPLKLSIDCEVTEASLTVTVSVESYIATIRLKPVIEQLNLAQPGLGWFVYDAVAAITRYPIVRVRDIGDMAQMIWYNGTDTDKALADELRAMDFDPDEPDSGDLSIDELKNRHAFAWPSDLAETVDGHAWMLGYYSRGHRRTKLTRPTSARNVRRFLLRSEAPSELKSIVAHALALSTEMSRKDGALYDACRPSEGYEEDAHPIGGACLLVWDDPAAAFEVLEHYEQYELECGNATDVHHTFSADPANDVEIARLVQSIKEFVHRHAAVTRVLQHFPIWKG